jgi:hypothetical protein
MNRLFQAFVARALEGAFRGTEFVVMREPPRYLDHDRRVLLKPDVVVRYANGELPLDAKYKDLVDAAQEDVYQVLAYCRGLTSHEGFIVLPGNQPPTSIRCTGGEQIVISRLDLASRAAMQTSANNLARAVRAHMQRAITGLTKPPPG